MSITRMLAHVIPATMQRSRARVAAVITVLCLAAGCNNPLAGEFGEPDEQTRRDVEKCGDEPSDKLAAPPGSYIDHGLAIDYVRVQRDKGYVDKILADPRMFEQVYADAVGGNATARWSVCLFEAVSRGAARQGARKLAGLRCQTIASCSFQPEKLPYSDATASGVRIFTLIADDFEAEAKRRRVAQEIFGHMLTLFVSTRVLSARIRAGPAATISRPAGGQGARPPVVRELTEAELASVRGAGPARYGPAAAGVVKTVPKPVYRPLTRANFRHNLAQRTGGIPDKAQAHHVLPVKFEPQCRKAGINIHEPRFGTWWKRGNHQSMARAYNNKWDEFFLENSNPTSKEILQFGREMARKYGLEIGF
jgi:hypothetical protein